MPELKQVMRAIGFDRVVVVQASTYGTDNSCVVDSIRELGSGARGVAVIDDKTTEASLDDMHRGGVRGIRLRLGNQGVTDPAGAKQRVKAAADRMKNRKGWSVLISGSPATWDALRVELAAVGVPIVIDHFGEPRVADGVRTAWIYGSPQSRQVRQGLRQAFQRRHTHKAARHVGRHAVCESADRREPAAGGLGHGVAASKRGAFLAANPPTSPCIVRPTMDR